MKTIYISKIDEMYDEETEEFFSIPATKITLEHSLVSISKWEAKWHKVYLSDAPKTNEEILSYIECMTITQNVNPYIYKVLPNKTINEITNYINDPMTATTVSEMPNSHHKKEIITSELVYYWMFKLGIPKECEKWHFNRLLTLIKIYGAKEDTGKKMSKNDILRQNRVLNAQRRARLKSKG